MSRDCVAEIHRDPDRSISSVDRIGQVASGFVPTVVSGRRFLTKYHRMLSRAPVGRSGHPACIDLDIEGFLKRADALKIYELAYFSQGDILELGTHKGLSTSIIARALIDSDVERTAQDTLSELGYSQFIEFNVSDATTMMDELIQRGRRFGFIFVDHWHGYTATYEAAIRAVDLLIEGGFVLFHDYNDSRNADPNHPHKVFQAVSDTLAKDPRFVFCTISGCCGLFQKQGWSDPSAK
jgi:hypothetical protein